MPIVNGWDGKEVIVKRCDCTYLLGLGGGVGIRYVGGGFKSPSFLCPPPGLLGRGGIGIGLSLIMVSFLWLNAIIIPKIF